MMYGTNYFYHYETAKKVVIAQRNWDGRTRWVYCYDNSGSSKNLIPDPNPKPMFFITLEEPWASLGAISLFKAEGPMGAFGAMVMYLAGKLPDHIKIQLEEPDDPTTLDWLFYNLEAMPIPKKD